MKRTPLSTRLLEPFERHASGARAEPRSLALIGGLLSKVPFRVPETTELCVPMVHALGFMQAIVGIALGSTLVILRRFDPEETLDSLEQQGANAMIVVPVMLRRMVDLGDEEIKQRDLSALKIIFVSGSKRSSCLGTAANSARTTSRAMCARISPATRSRARLCSSMNYHVTRPERCSRASSRRRTDGDERYDGPTGTGHAERHCRLLAAHPRLGS